MLDARAPFQPSNECTDNVRRKVITTNNKQTENKVKKDSLH